MEEDHLKGRPVGQTEHSHCFSLPLGSGIVVIAFLFSKSPETSHIESALHKLQTCHPILRSKLQSNTTKNSFSFITYPKPFLKVNTLNASSTLSILQNVSNSSNESLSPFHLLLEHELNQNPWRNSKGSVKTTTTTEMMFCSIYTLPNLKWVVSLRFHIVACDRTSSIYAIRQFVGLLGGEDIEMESGNNEGEVGLPIEKLIPNGKAKKALWARGKDMIGISLDSLRTTNLKFVNLKATQSTELLRLQMNPEETQNLLAGCKLREIKLCGVLTAAALMAAYGSKRDHDHHSKYLVATVLDCRPLLDPPLTHNNFGIYQSAFTNTYTLKGGEKLWDLAKKCHTTFQNSKTSGKHFTDMADVNFLMCKAAENPSISSSSIGKSTYLSVFAETVVEDDSDISRQLGIEDYTTSASIHGLCASLVLFDTIKNGRLDCICGYSSPQHSRDQIRELLDDMKSFLVDS